MFSNYNREFKSYIKTIRKETIALLIQIFLFLFFILSKNMFPLTWFSVQAFRSSHFLEWQLNLWLNRGNYFVSLINNSVTWDSSTLPSALLELVPCVEILSLCSIAHLFTIWFSFFLFFHWNWYKFRLNCLHLIQLQFSCF